MMWIIIFTAGVICGTFCMALASVSKDEIDISEEDEKELLDYIDKKYKSDGE